MKHLIIVLTFTGTLFFTSCEKSEILEVNVENVENVEQIVVESEIETGELFKSVRITRTRPISEDYYIENAEIKDAYVYLRINGVKLVPLHYKTKGLYAPLTEFRVQQGDIYELFGKIKGNDVYSITKVPFIPNVLSVRFDPEGFYEASVSAVSGEAYGALWVIFDNPNQFAKNFYSIEPARDISLNTRTIKLEPKYLSSQFDGKRRVRVYAFDRQYVDYFRTKSQSDHEDSGVTTGGSGVAWNVIGKNTIGLFIGVAKVTLTDPL